MFWQKDRLRGRVWSAMLALAVGLCWQDPVSATNSISSFRSPPPNVIPRIRGPVQITGEKVMPIIDGPKWLIDHFSLVYADRRSGALAIAELLRCPLVLGYKDRAYVTPFMPVQQCRHRLLRAGVTLVHTSLSQLNSAAKPSFFHLSALDTIGVQLGKYFGDRGLAAVRIVIPPVDEAALTKNPGSSLNILHLVIHLAVVTHVGLRVQQVNGGLIPWPPLIGTGIAFEPWPTASAYNWIIHNSPVQARSASTSPASNNLYLQEKVESYVDAINRGGNRYVYPAILPGNPSVPDSISLNYDIRQFSKPWVAYFQLANTGTPATGLWRETYGFLDSQLTGHDDVLSLDYETAGFSKQNSIQGSYSYALFRPDILRLRVFGGYSGFQSSEFGIPGPGFLGDQSFGGVEAIANLFQYRRLFVDLRPGIRYEHLFADNSPFAIAGSADIIEPYIALDIQRYATMSSLDGSLELSTGFSGSNEVDLEDQGRPLVAKDWAVLKGYVSYSFYLEPWLSSTSFCEGHSTLANELRLSLDGQDAFGYRLIPEEEFVAGGLSGMPYGNVRGYPQYSAAGDSAIVGSIEYRLHIPHLFHTRQRSWLFGQPFRFLPLVEHPYYPTDWDLIPFVFLDAGEIVNSNAQSFEQNSTPVGTGLGADFKLSSNVDIQVDWGVALNPIGTPGVNRVSADSSEFNFVLSVSY